MREIACALGGYVLGVLTVVLIIRKAIRDKVKSEFDKWDRQREEY
jgi:hypothetical protein